MIKELHFKNIQTLDFEMDDETELLNTIFVDKDYKIRSFTLSINEHEGNLKRVKKFFDKHKEKK